MHPVKHVAGTAIDDDRTRRWVTNLRRPERLDDPVLRALLRAHGRDAGGGPVEVGRRGAELLHEKIEALRPAGTGTRSEALPHLVLTTCFVEGTKSFQAAALLGLSERQLSRERARAISLLTAELASVAPARRSRLPRCGGLVARPAPAQLLSDALASSRRVHVRGAPGSGKTCAVAALAAAFPGPVHWLTGVARVNAELATLLFDLGEDLAPEDPSLAAYMRESLPAPNDGLATRIALVGLGRGPRLLVVDDFDALAGDTATTRFLDEATRRLPLLRIVTAGRNHSPGTGVPEVVVPPFTVAEARALVELRSVPAAALAPRLHAWTGGNARLLDLATRVAAGRSSGEAAAASVALRAAARGDHLLSCARALARSA